MEGFWIQIRTVSRLKLVILLFIDQKKSESGSQKLHSYILALEEGVRRLGGRGRGGGRAALHVLQYSAAITGSASGPVAVHRFSASHGRALDR